MSHATHIVVLDDDHSILEYWNKRITEQNIIPVLLSSYDQALEWLNTNSLLIESTVFIADYELGNSIANGLNFLNHVKNNSNRYLITSHAEELSLQSEVEKSGIWLISKLIIGEIDLVI